MHAAARCKCNEGALWDRPKEPRCRACCAVAPDAEDVAERGRGCSGWPSRGCAPGTVISVEGRMSDRICAADVYNLTAGHPHFI